MEIQKLIRSTYIVINLNNGETLFMGTHEECENYIWGEEIKINIKNYDI